jgi:plastocyanin
VSAADGGTIKGRITFTGKEPGNRVIRMGMDPMCATANAGKRPINEVYLVGDNNALGNVFVKLEGSFPATPVPSQPVEIDQVACFYKPRVVGARVGQTLRVKNLDNLMHNVHSDSAKGNAFNFAEPIKGMQRDITLKDEEMLRIGCDVHRWMTAGSASCRIRISPSAMSKGPSRSPTCRPGAGTSPRGMRRSGRSPRPST